MPSLWCGVFDDLAVIGVLAVISLHNVLVFGMTDAEPIDVIMVRENSHELLRVKKTLAFNSLP